MADQQRNTNEVENHGNHGVKPEESYVELNANERPSEEAAAAASFDTLISDCLEMIFKHLDIKSLVNVAGTCKRLQSEAVLFHNEKYYAEKVTLYHNFDHSCFIEVAGKSRIKGLNLCLAFLRIFGGDISELTVQWHTWAAYKFINPMDILTCKCHTSLDQYVNRYCAESLSTISFYDKSEFSNENYVKPFINVDTVHLFHCGLAKQLPCFVDWFPNLRNLHIGASSVLQLSIGVQLHFPQLEHLSIEIPNDDEQLMCIRDGLRQNPQLQSLQVYSDHGISMNDLLNLIDENLSIVKLSTNFSIEWNVDAFETVRMAKEHPLLLELDMRSYKFNANDAIYLIRRLTSLKEIQFGFQTIEDINRFSRINDWEFIHHRCACHMKRK